MIDDDVFEVLKVTHSKSASVTTFSLTLASQLAIPLEYDSLTVYVKPWTQQANDIGIKLPLTTHLEPHGLFDFGGREQLSLWVYLKV